MGIPGYRLKGFEGFFPVKGVIIDNNGIVDYGNSSGAALISFQNLATFEVGCFDYNDTTLSVLNTSRRTQSASSPSSRTGQQPVDGPFDARLRFGKVCGSELPLTITDRWFAGTFENFSILNDEFSNSSIQIEQANITLSHLASLDLTLSYDPSTPTPSLELIGNALIGETTFEGAGSLKQVDGLPGLSLLFNPLNQKLGIIPDHVTAQVPGGGLFYRPTSTEIDLVELVLNEISNNSFSSNYPGLEQPTGITRDAKLSLVLPVEVDINERDGEADFSGIGVFKKSEQIAYLDLDGYFLGDEEHLKSNLFLLQKQDRAFPEAQSLEGLARISLNYSSVAGGVVSTNFSLAPRSGSGATWSSVGRSNFLITDTITLPGTFLLTQDGFLLDLNARLASNKGHISVDDGINVSLWKERDAESISGYTAFNTSIDLIPGFMFNMSKMYGGLIQDREEYQLYAANNQYVDVPFVFNGPIDPWLSFQDGSVFGGDARNTAFRRMIFDARESGKQVTVLAEQAIDSLQYALDVQSAVANNAIATGTLTMFARPDSLLQLSGDEIYNLQSQLSDQDLPSIFTTVRDELYGDPSLPDYGYLRAVHLTPPQQWLR